MMSYRAYTLTNFREIPQLSALSEDLKRDIEIVGRVLPFKVNNCRQVAGGDGHRVTTGK